MSNQQQADMLHRLTHSSLQWYPFIQSQYVRPWSGTLLKEEPRQAGDPGQIQI